MTLNTLVLGFKFRFKIEIMDMKKLSIYTLAVASMIGALEAESLFLITGENGEVTENFDWNDTSKWTPTVSGVPATTST